jgi:hypothetical protein
MGRGSGARARAVAWLWLDRWVQVMDHESITLLEYESCNQVVIITELESNSVMS